MKPALQSHYHQGYRHVVAGLQAAQIEQPPESQVRLMASEWLTNAGLLFPEAEKQELIDSITYGIVGLGPLEFLLRDETVSEIMVNGHDQVFVEKSGRLLKTDMAFVDDAQVLQVINRIVGKIGRRIDESTPLVDARLLDGSRVNAIIPPLSLTGPVLTIRKFSKEVFGIDKMLEYQSIDQDMKAFLETAVTSRKNILISGGTGAGKTSTLNACASLIPHSERIVTIEDAAEIRIDHPHLISLEARAANIEGEGEIPIRKLLKNALRMRPDRIVVGEIRGGEAIDMLQAMNTGHQGSLTTVHANSPIESLFRIETMVLMGNIDLPLTAIRPQVIQGIDIICQQQRLVSGERKIISISQVKKSFQSQEYQVEELFRYDPKTKKFINLLPKK